jgi:hypothetical protein
VFVTIACLLCLHANSSGKAGVFNIVFALRVRLCFCVVVMRLRV